MPFPSPPDRRADVDAQTARAGNAPPEYLQSSRRGPTARAALNTASSTSQRGLGSSGQPGAIFTVYFNGVFAVVGFVLVLVAPGPHNSGDPSF